MMKNVRALMEYFAEIPDPRNPQGLRHPLASILCLCCVAMMSGAKTPKAIANWWKNRHDLGPFLERLGFTKSYGPSKSTLYRILAIVPIEMLEKALQRWAEDNMADSPPADDELEGIAIDGKSLRGSRKQGAENAHLLSAFSHRIGLTLKQLGVEDKTNEIGAMPDLLAGLLVEGRVFTMDALHTQRDTAQTIVHGGGDYVMIAKDNQPTLRAEIERLFVEPNVEALVVDSDTTVNDGHGRLEMRSLQPRSISNDFLDWPGVRQVFRLDRETTILKQGKVRRETVCGLTSLSNQSADAAGLQRLVRGQWSIENRSHWVRDVTFGEDASQVRNGSLPEAMAALRNLVIGLLRSLDFRIIPDAFDYFAARPFEALVAVGC